MTTTGFAAVANGLGVKAPEIWTVFAVETSGCGFLPDRRPPILYERHIFSRLTGGQFDDGDISSPTSGGYGPSGAAQYNRLARAVALDRRAALQSASWGLGQIMGMNFAMAGFGNVEDMVAAMCDSEDSQMIAFAAFLKLEAPHRPADPRLDCVRPWLQWPQLRPEPIRYKAARGIPEIFDRLAARYHYPRRPALSDSSGVSSRTCGRRRRIAHERRFAAVPDGKWTSRYRPGRPGNP